MEKETLKCLEAQKTPKMPFFHPFSRRLGIILLIMVGMFSLSLMRMNIGIGMTCMVNSTSFTLQNLRHSSDPSFEAKIGQPKCSRSGKDAGVVNDYGGTLEWDPSTQGYIFAAGFWGSLLTIVPSGLIADAWSPVRMLEIAGVALVITTGLTPFFAVHFGAWSVFGLRFFMGLFEGLVLPSVNKLASQWIPNSEKSTAVSMYTSGNQLGGILGIPIFAFCCSVFIGWPLIFYLSSTVGVLWLLLWHNLVKESPEKCKSMGERERVYLQSFPELQSSGKNRRFGIPPFKSLLTSPAFLSLLLCSMATNMVASILQIYLPTFLKEVLFLSSVDNGLFSAAPPLIQFLSKMMWSVSIDHFKTRGLSPTVAVKLSQGITNFGSAVLLVAIGYYADCTQPYIALALFCLLGICFSTATSGFFTSMVSLAPSYTGIITSISFVFGVTGRSLPSIVVPYFNKTGSLEEWRNVFFVTSTLLVVSGIIFVLFGSGHPQKWGFEPEQKKSVQEQKIDLSNLVAANEMGSMMLETVDA